MQYFLGSAVIVSPDVTFNTWETQILNLRYSLKCFFSQFHADTRSGKCHVSTEWNCKMAASPTRWFLTGCRVVLRRGGVAGSTKKHPPVWPGGHGLHRLCRKAVCSSDGTRHTFHKNWARVCNSKPGTKQLKHLKCTKQLKTDVPFFIYFFLPSLFFFFFFNSNDFATVEFLSGNTGASWIALQ